MDTGRLKEAIVLVIIYAALVLAVSGYPITNERETPGKILSEEEVKSKKSDLYHVAYVENFKDLMLSYVKSEYNNLTINEMEEIKQALEDFLHSFAKDLKDIVEGDGVREQIDILNDGIPDATFDDVKENIKFELPELDDKAASHIVYKLRKNLMMTRKKLEGILKEAEKSAKDNS